jgi:rhodanese-related sulfurtransferase
MTSEVSDRCGLASIRRITPEEAWSLTSEGKAVLVDTRPGSYYGEAHAGGAISMPFEDIRRDPRAAIDALPSDQLIVLYCA